MPTELTYPGFDGEVVKVTLTNGHGVQTVKRPQETYYRIWTDAHQARIEELISSLQNHPDTIQSTTILEPGQTGQFGDYKVTFPNNLPSGENV